MTNEVKRSLGQKTRLFLDYCCFCGLLGQIHPRSSPFSKSLGVPNPFSWSALGIFHPARYFLETGAVALLGFLCLSATAMETRASVQWAVGTGSAGPGTRRPSAPSSGLLPREPRGVRGEARLACGRPPAPGLPHWPGLRGPPFPPAQRGTPRCHGSLRRIARTPAT